MSIKENNKMIYLFSAIAFVVLLIVALAAACESGKGTKRTDESVPDSAVYYDSNVDTEEVSSSPEQESQEITEPVIEVLSGNISEELDKISKKYGAVAVQAAVIEDGHVRYVYNYGYADLNKKTPPSPFIKI